MDKGTLFFITKLTLVILFSGVFLLVLWHILNVFRERREAASAKLPNIKEIEDKTVRLSNTKIYVVDESAIAQKIKSEITIDNEEQKNLLNEYMKRISSTATKRKKLPEEVLFLSAEIVEPKKLKPFIVDEFETLLEELNDDDK